VIVFNLNDDFLQGQAFRKMQLAAKQPVIISEVGRIFN